MRKRIAIDGWATASMANRVPKYALIGGREAFLLEVVTHAASHESACIYEDDAGNRRYALKSEWDVGVEEFARFAADRRLVTSESLGREKIALFKSLFKGREDVYAHGFAKKDGGIGYSPTCANERTRRCPRWTRSNRGTKCADCPAREFVPMDERAILAHFKGERDDLTDVAGLYVLDRDCKTWVLVADFDKAGWQREALLYRDACRSYGLFPAVERSRSGNGAHVWLFFEERIDAELARNLGCTLITHAMSQAAGMGFEAYDRLFPAQSTMVQGGLGNLIALPFQGRAQRQSNTVFVDDGFEPYPDQWRFLSSVSKATPRQVREIVESANGAPLGQLAFAGRANAKTCASTKLSSKRSATPPSNEASRVFPKTINVTRANMLYVSKRGLSSSAQNQIRRLAAFGNPEFYRAQAIHRSVFGKRRIVWCGEEDGRSIMLPRGCERKLERLASEHGCSCLFDDKRKRGEPIEVEFTGVLREGQKEAADALLRYENGVLSAPTGFGKTVVGAYLVGELKMRTLIIVPQTNLIEQWKERLERFLDIKDNRPPLLTKSGKPSKRVRPVIGQIGGGRNAPSGIVDIATFQSLTARDELGIPQAKPIVADYELIICDECHHGAAPNLELVMKSANARRVYGLSATPKRSDGLEGIIFMQCGPIRHKADPKDQAAEQGFKRILKPRFARIRLTGLGPGASFNQVLDLLCEHGARNALIAKDAAAAVRTGRMPLVITKRKEHAAKLAKLLEKEGIRVFVLTGDGTARVKRERIEQVRGMAGERYAIVATGSYIGEGFDLPQLDTLFLASPYSWEGVIAQYSGRLHRESEGKSDVVVYDYVDASIPVLERMYKKRLKAYAKLGYEITASSEAQGPGARIVTAEAWRAEFVSDFSRASESVVISAPYASAKFVELLGPDVENACARGIAVRIILRKPEGEDVRAAQSDVAKNLSKAGCAVEVRDSPLTGIAIFDGKVTWYGTLPLLAFAKADDCSLRVEGGEVAADLGETLSLGSGTG